MDDQAVVAAQLERSLRATSTVEARCHLGLPIVTGVPPILDDGTPFPTRWWLTCPLATRRIGRLESVGGVRAMERHLAANPDAAAAFEAAHARYAAERDALIPDGAEHRPSGGVAGVARGVKCLHAHYADHASGHDNPVGAAVAVWVEPLDCRVACCVETDAGVVRNPEWSEPK